MKIFMNFHEDFLFMNSWWNHQLFVKYSSASPPYVHELSWKWSHCKPGCVYGMWDVTCFIITITMNFIKVTVSWNFMKFHEYYPMNFITVITSWNLPHFMKFATMNFIAMTASLKTCLTLPQWILLISFMKTSLSSLSHSVYSKWDREWACLHSFVIHKQFSLQSSKGQ